MSDIGSDIIEKKIAEHIEIKIEAADLPDKLIKKIFKNEFEHLPNVEEGKTPYIKVREQTEDGEPRVHWNMVTFEKLTFYAYHVTAVFSISKDKCEPAVIKKLVGLLKKQLKVIEETIVNIGNTKSNLERILDVSNIDFEWNDLNKKVFELKEENRKRKEEINILIEGLEKLQKGVIPPGIDMVG